MITFTRVSKGVYLNKRPVSRRHRRDNGYSTPLGEYGGTTIHVKCQRPKEKRS